MFVNRSMSKRTFYLFAISLGFIVGSCLHMVLYQSVIGNKPCNNPFKGITNETIEHLLHVGEEEHNLTITNSDSNVLKSNPLPPVPPPGVNSENTGGENVVKNTKDAQRDKIFFIHPNKEAATIPQQGFDGDVGILKVLPNDTRYLGFKSFDDKDIFKKLEVRQKRRTEEKRDKGEVVQMTGQNDGQTQQQNDKQQQNEQQNTRDQQAVHQTQDQTANQNQQQQQEKPPDQQNSARQNQEPQQNQQSQVSTQQNQEQSSQNQELSSQNQEQSSQNQEPKPLQSGVTDLPTFIKETLQKQQDLQNQQQKQYQYKEQQGQQNQERQGTISPALANVPTERRKVEQQSQSKEQTQQQTVENKQQNQEQSQNQDKQQDTGQPKQQSKQEENKQQQNQEKQPVLPMGDLAMHMKFRNGPNKEQNQQQSSQNQQIEQQPIVKNKNNQQQPPLMANKFLQQDAFVMQQDFKLKNEQQKLLQEQHNRLVGLHKEQQEKRIKSMT